MVINGGGKFQEWTASGALATVAWFLVLAVYCTFRAFKIEDPIIGQAFLLLTGLWVGNLTIAQGKKQAKVEEKADTAVEKVRALESRANASDKRSDGQDERAEASEQRESQRSLHPEGDDS